MSTFLARGDLADSPRSSAAERTSNRKGVLIAIGCVLMLLLGTLILRLLAPPISSVPLSSTNPEPEGARAAAQILGEHGVQVREVHTTQAVLDAAGTGSTVLLTDPALLREEQLSALSGVGADLVIVNLDFDSIEALTDHVTATGGGAHTSYDARCADEHATAAEDIVTAGPGVQVSDGVVGCFPIEGEEDQTSYAMATWTEGQQRWSVVPNSYPLSNEGIAEAGNAALMLRLLGQHERLTWYVPDPLDPYSTGSDQAAPELLPPELVSLAALLALTVVLWRGRRLGPVVVEHLPVVVRATETTRGRGRLYRRARAVEHASSALRAGTIRRLARRTGIPRTADPAEVVETLARASGRPPEAIDSLLYGPPPTDDASLLALTNALDTLEGEVHRT
ncbi:DUF4350 domain-containing protein [Ruania halotolerans]|uniref:DUF4350 domain-containing protein n=1 Tax=Ruania halotolerans TaxID=2897773 RepID=UPI001E32B477|nr:DUF4350 domain-containing protein [Ruania halotolerans]UFU07584.1 DUF4350 domain-containing protein [Ruania halotolerans]